jgi:hypothetical protein
LNVKILLLLLLLRFTTGQTINMGHNIHIQDTKMAFGAGYDYYRSGFQDGSGVLFGYGALGPFYYGPNGIISGNGYHVTGFGVANIDGIPGTTGWSPMCGWNFPFLGRLAYPYASQCYGIC